MVAAFYLLLVIGHLGVFDVLYFHTYRCQLDRRPECQREVLWHTLRHAIYATQFIVIANFRFHGAALFLLAFVYGADVFIAWADVLEETDSRRAQGGLPRGEYFMHIVLSLLVGCYFMLVLQTVWSDRNLPIAIVFDPPPVPALLRVYMTLMGIGAIGAFFVDSYRWFTFHRRPALQVVKTGQAQESQ
jgi:hypothetical protein